MQESEKRSATCCEKAVLARSFNGEPKKVELLAHFSNPPDILPSIFLTESQIFVQAKAHIVPIKTVGGKAKVQQMLFESYGNGGFTAGRETGKPEGEALLAAQGTALVVRKAVVPCYISGAETVSSLEREGKGRGRRTYVAITICDGRSS